jgi:hypothetical protein
MLYSEHKNNDSWLAKVKNYTTNHLFILTLVITIVSLFYRRPDTFFNPHFWAEEGLVFYAEAYQDGWKSLFNTCAGYFHVYPRLIVNIAIQTNLPLHFAPFLFSASCLLINFLLILYVWKRLPFSEMQRFFIAITLVMIPLQAEVFMNLTNIQWCIVFFPLIIFSNLKQGDKIFITILDIILIFFSAFTGPNFVVLLPLFLLLLLLNRKELIRNKLFSILIISGMIAGCIGIYFLKLHGSVSRTEGSFDLSNKGFIQYLFVQFYYLIIGKFAFRIPLMLMIAGLLLVLTFYFTLIKWLLKNKERKFEWIILASNILFIATTLVAYRSDPELLSPYYRGVRNFYIPSVTIVWLLIRYMEFNKKSNIIVSLLFIFFTLETIVFVGRFKIDAPDLKVYEQQLITNQHVEVPILPEGWKMKLIKKEIHE